MPLQIKNVCAWNGEPKSSTADIQVSRCSVDKAAKEFTSAILSAAHKSKPFWNNELDDLRKQVCDAREQMEKQPSTDNIANHYKLKDTFEQKKVNQIQESWREKTSSLNLEKDTTKLWQLTNLLNDDNCQQKKTTLLVDNQCITGKKSGKWVHKHLRKSQHNKTVTGENKRSPPRNQTFSTGWTSTMYDRKPHNAGTSMCT